jgi:hypothetical protein
VVINFTVVDDPEILVLIGHGLVAILKVNNAQTAHGQTNISVDENSFIVRSTMDDLQAHSSKSATLNPGIPVTMKNSADSAHRLRISRARIEFGAG